MNHTLSQDRRSRATLAERGTWLVPVARFGYLVRGVLYLAIGAVAIAAESGLAERPRGSSSILRLVGRQPFGELILLVVALGFLSYAALNFVGALGNPAGRDRKATATLLRAADVITGGVYLGLAAAAVLTLAVPDRSAGHSIEVWFGRALGLPFGQVLLGAGGVLLFGSGAYLAYKSVAYSFASRLDRRALSPTFVRWVVGAARLGTAVRSLIFGICGWLVLYGAVESAPERVGGVGRAVTTLQQSPFGSWLVRLVGIGLVGYGVYQFVKARYRRIRLDVR